MQARISFLPMVALAALLGMSLGCAQKADDAKIAGTIQSSFNTDSGLQGKQLGVQAEAGVVTLSGTVDNDIERNAAARYASAAPGVKQVVNNLKVGGEPAPAEIAQTVPDQPPAKPAPSIQPAPQPEPQDQPAPRKHHKRDTPPVNHYPNEPAPPEEAAQADQPTMPATGDVATNPPAPAAPQPPPPPPPQKVTIASGTTLSVRLVDAVGSDTSQQGQAFHATLNAPLAVGGDVAIPVGYEVSGHVVDVENGGKFTGKAQLTLQLDRISVNGKHYDIQTDTYHKETKSRGTNTAEKVGAGSVIGAIIGGIAGGGKGAAIGAAAGGGVGGGAQAASKTPQVRLPSETVLTFTLQSPLTVLPTTQGPDAGRPKLDAGQPPPDNPPDSQTGSSSKQ